MRWIDKALISTLLALSTAASGANMPPNSTLYQGQAVQSDDGRYFLIMQTDGNLVMYRRSDGNVRFATYRYGHRTVMQGDGQFVEYSASNQPLWFTGTAGNPGSYLSVQNDGNLVVYNMYGQPLWNIGPDNSGKGNPTKAGDVLGRNLNAPLGDQVGHIGIWDGSRVIEALGYNSINALAVSSLESFKSAAGPSGYWGVASPNVPYYTYSGCFSTYCLSNTPLEYVTSRYALARRAYQAYLIGADYTLSAFYTQAWPSFSANYLPQRGMYRCDTFVFDVYESVSYFSTPLWKSKLNELRNMSLPTPLKAFNYYSTM